MTPVDVVLRGSTATGPVALLVEVKLTERYFGHCSAALNPNNDSLDVCATNMWFGDNTERCFHSETTA